MKTRPRPTLSALCLIAGLGMAASASAGRMTNVFDQGTGANTYQGGFGDFNWVAGPFAGVVPHSGAEAFLSFWGGVETFHDIGITKDLGGVIQLGEYQVSFFITKYGGGQPLEFADFSSLRIGGPYGTVLWTSTPTPTVDTEWVQWTGIYVPDLADIGGPFLFQAIFDLDGGHSLGFDGPVEAENLTTPVRSITWGGIKARYGDSSRRP